MILVILLSLLTAVFVSIATNRFTIGSVEINNLCFFKGRDNTVHGIFNIIIGDGNDITGNFNLVIGDDFVREKSFKIFR